MFARSASVVASNKKVQLTLIGSWLRTYRWVLRWTMYVAPTTSPLPFPWRRLKNAKRPFSKENRTLLKESLLQSFFVWTLSQRQCCKTYFGLSIHAEMIGRGQGDVLSTWKFGIYWHPPPCKASILNLFSLV